MSQKLLATVGLEYDLVSLRAAKLSSTRTGNKTVHSLIALAELPGAFSKDEELIAALKKIKGKLAIGPADRIITCVSGKQVYAAMHPFRRLPPDELAGAIKFEIRKNLPFEVNSAAIDYQIINDTDQKSEQVQIMVGAAAHTLMSRHQMLLDKAGYKADVVDVLPLALANAFWRDHVSPSAMESHIILHIGPDVSTIIILGDTGGFFHRTIPFAAHELYGDKKDENLAPKERERRHVSLGEEIVRSLSFYETTFHTGTGSAIHVMGNFAMPELCGLVFERTGLHMEFVDVVKGISQGTQVPPGRFDLAVTLAMRED